MEGDQRSMKTIKLYLDTEGNLTCSQDLSNLTQYTFQENLLSVCVPKEIIENQNVAVSVVFSSQDTTGELETESYNMQYVKDIVSDSAEYYLYSRLSPKRMTLYSGTQQLAINISYLKNGACISRTTSQRLSYNVVASDYDLETEEVSDKEDLQSQIDTINQKLDNDYQTKVDTNIKVASDNDSTKYDSDFVNTVVGALTKLDERVKEHQKYLFNSTYDSEKGTIESRIETNENGIADNKSSIEKHETRITTLESKISEFFHFLGSFEYDYEGEPTDTDLDNALTEKGHTEKHIGDCLLAISTYGEQDTLYICIWNGSAWTKQNVVGIQKADNDNYGVIKGNDRVKIASGEVQGIYTLINNNYVDLDNAFYAIWQSIGILNTNIETETTRAKNVENSLTEKDTDLQNQINETKNDLEENYVKGVAMIEYCLPRVFNDTYYVNYKTMTLENELTDTSTLISVATGSTDIGTFSYVVDTFDFELSRRNNLSLRLYFNDNDDISKTIKLSITLNAFLNKHGVETQLCTYTKDFTFDDNNITSIDLDTTLNSLKDSVLKVESDDIITLKLSINNDYSNTFALGLYSNTAYASTFTFNTDFKNVAFTKGQVGEIPTLYVKYDSDNQYYIAYEDSEYSKVASVNSNIMYDLKFISIDTLESDLTNNVKTQITYDTQTLECLLKSNGSTFTNATLLSLIANGDRILTLFNGSAFELVDSAIYNLKQDLSNEKTTRANADTQIQTNLSKEIQERKEQDTTLQSNIDTLTKQVETFHPTITDKSMTHLIYENMLNYYMPIEITEDDSNTFAYDNLIVNSGVLQYLCENNKITFADSVTSSMGLFLMSDIRETFSDLNINNVTKVSGWFALCYNLVSVKEPTHNNTITDFNGLCFDCFNLLDIDWNMDGATDLGSAFYNCERLQATPSGDLTECYNLENAFKGCKSLETFNFTNIGCSFDLSDCVKLSHDTLVSIISTLQTTTNSSTLTLGTTLKSLLSDSEIKVATDKGWTIE
jgi:hypothetical protein